MLVDDVEYVLGMLITFTDGGDAEGQILHRGTKEECQSAAEFIDACSYSGNRPVQESRLFIAPASVYDTFTEGGGSA